MIGLDIYGRIDEIQRAIWLAGQLADVQAKGRSCFCVAATAFAICVGRVRHSNVIVLLAVPTIGKQIHVGMCAPLRYGTKTDSLPIHA